MTINKVLTTNYKVQSKKLYLQIETKVPKFYLIISILESDCQLVVLNKIKKEKIYLFQRINIFILQTFFSVNNVLNTKNDLPLKQWYQNR